MRLFTGEPYSMAFAFIKITRFKNSLGLKQNRYVKKSRASINENCAECKGKFLN